MGKKEEEGRGRRREGGGRRREKEGVYILVHGKERRLILGLLLNVFEEKGFINLLS